MPLARQLMGKGAAVQFHDPHFSDWRAVPEAARVTDAAAAVAQADLTILVQNHREYDVDALAGAAHVCFDTRGEATEAEKVTRL